MRVEALDHVNIITADLEGTAHFYAEIFGLEPRDGPPPLTHENARWMYDAAGRAVIHVNSLDCPRAYDRWGPAGPTGALHHVALRCSGHGELCARLARAGLEHLTTDNIDCGSVIKTYGSRRRKGEEVLNRRQAR